MGLQPVRGERLAFEVDDQPCAVVAVEAKLGSALQIPPQGGGLSAFPQRRTGLPDHGEVILNRYFAQTQSADHRRRTACDTQLAQQPLLADEKPLAQKGETE